MVQVSSWNMEKTTSVVMIAPIALWTELDMACLWVSARMALGSGSHVREPFPEVFPSACLSTST